MNFLLLDLETTGLDPGSCRVIEVAARLLAPGRELARYHSLVGSDLMEEYWEDGARDMHVTSGLAEESRICEKTIEQVDDELADFIGTSQVYLMGNSVHFDRSFIRCWMPVTMMRIHYRQLDVTSIRLWWQLMTGHDPLDWEKSRGHRAQDDLEATLDEARRYWQRR